MTTPIPTPQPFPSQKSQDSAKEVFEQRRLLGEQKKLEERQKQAIQILDSLYRKPSKKESLLVAVDTDLLEKYAVFLQDSNTGLIKLLNSFDCAKNSQVLVASDNCLNNTMPGAGASYSFRYKNYRIPQLADISLVENSFKVTGDWLHGIFVDVGDIALNLVDFKIAGMQYLSNFPPALEFQSAKETDYKLAAGIMNKGLIYKRQLPIRENTTYLLRSIAYRGEVLKTVEGFVYNELDYDKRKDVIIAFRVVKQDLDGSVIIAWKLLSSKNSPKIEKLEKKENIKENRYTAKSVKEK
ncbi:MAG: hypothetical protein K1X72_20895 [Pyrinomonadaceae bacterium]|nr:hypothetical protein [Pyrinomonadaceae bacterium]